MLVRAFVRGVLGGHFGLHSGGVQGKIIQIVLKKKRIVKIKVNIIIKIQMKKKGEII